MSVIYALACPATGEVRYVGMTTRTAEKRLAEHLYPSAVRRGHTLVYAWLQTLGQPPHLFVLEQDPPDLPAAERTWIALMREQGYALLNSTGGGGGLHIEGASA